MRNTTHQIFPNFFLTVSYLHTCPRQFVTIFLFPLYFLWKLKRVVLHRPLEKLQSSSSACKSQAFLYLQCLQKGISCFIMTSFLKLLWSWSILLLVYFFFDELLIHTFAHFSCCFASIPFDLFIFIINYMHNKYAPQIWFFIIFIFGIFIIFICDV